VCDIASITLAAYQTKEGSVRAYFSYTLVGLFERAEDLAPLSHAYEAEKLSWLHIVDEAPGKKTG
jgi:hypothetical protein